MHELWSTRSDDLLIYWATEQSAFPEGLSSSYQHRWLIFLPVPGSRHLGCHSGLHPVILVTNQKPRQICFLPPQTSPWPPLSDSVAEIPIHALITFKSPHALASWYLFDLLHLYTSSRVLRFSGTLWKSLPAEKCTCPPKTTVMVNYVVPSKYGCYYSLCSCVVCFDLPPYV